MDFASRALMAALPALSLLFGRVATPINGMSDPRYGFFSTDIHLPGFSLAPGFGADHSAAHLEDGPLSFKLSANYAPISSNFGPPPSPIRRASAPVALQQCPNISFRTCEAMVTSFAYGSPPWSDTMLLLLRSALGCHASWRRSVAVGTFGGSDNRRLAGGNVLASRLVLGNQRP